MIYEEYLLSKSYYDSEHLAARRELPIWAHRQQLVDAVASKQVVLVTGDTGSGKTTQLVQVGAGVLNKKIPMLRYLPVPAGGRRQHQPDREDDLLPAQETHRRHRRREDRRRTGRKGNQ